MAPDARAAGPGRRARWRWAGLSLLAAFAVWHAIFDLTVHDGMHAYIEANSRHLRGAGPAVTIHGVMDDAVRRGAWWGLSGAALVLAGASGLARWRAGKTRREQAG